MRLGDRDDEDLAQRGLKEELYAADIAGDGAVDTCALELLEPAWS